MAASRAFRDQPRLAWQKTAKKAAMLALTPVFPKDCLVHLDHVWVRRALLIVLKVGRLKPGRLFLQAKVQLSGFRRAGGLDLDLAVGKAQVQRRARGYGGRRCHGHAPGRADKRKAARQDALI